jgi:hypothetical protein
MKKIGTRKTDFRIYTLLPLIIAAGTIVAFFYLKNNGTAKFWSWQGAVLVALVTILTRYGSLIHFPLARFYYRDMLNGVKEYFVLNIEQYNTREKFKWVPDNIGILFMKGGEFILKTNDALYQIEPSLIFGEIITSKVYRDLKGIRWQMSALNEDWVVTPVYDGLKYKMGLPELRIEWMKKKVGTWIQENTGDKK